MSEPIAPIRITLRIPGKWPHPRELLAALPADCRLTPKALILADGTKVDFDPMPPDDQFADIFRSSCRRPATPDELATVDAYTVNVCLSGPGGSQAAALQMMRAGAAIVKAGGAGVFIDNSALAHGGQNWLEMTEDGGSDALSFAFVSLISSPTEVWTMGMHVLGLRDVIMKRVDADDFDIIEVIRYLCQSEKPIENGHILADLEGPRFTAFVEESPEMPEGSPMHNPFGRLRLVSTRDIAEKN